MPWYDYLLLLIAAVLGTASGWLFAGDYPGPLAPPVDIAAARGEPPEIPRGMAREPTAEGPVAVPSGAAPAARRPAPPPEVPRAAPAPPPRTGTPPYRPPARDATRNAAHRRR